MRIDRPDLCYDDNSIRFSFPDGRYLFERGIVTMSGEGSRAEEQMLVTPRIVRIAS